MYMMYTQLQCVHVRHRLHSTKQYNGKVPDIAMHMLVVYILDELYLIIIPPSIIPPSVHQMHTNVLLCHLGISLLNHLQNKPNHFLNTM
jgi:hypothetical protein